MTISLEKTLRVGLFDGASCRRRLLLLLRTQDPGARCTASYCRTRHNETRGQTCPRQDQRTASYTSAHYRRGPESCEYSKVKDVVASV
eukprot:5295124-Pleurochrysis_carterae.AAC.6